LILVDVNLLVYSQNELSEQHIPARHWLDAQLSGTAPVCLCWPVISAFIRVTTNRRIFECPLALSTAIDRVEGWLAQPCVRIVNPTENHWALFRELLLAGTATANLVADAHLAALAIEHGCELNSTDRDFARFPKLAWRNPLRESMPPRGR
jgi:toxin-antitoxin system PIN domain toxin